jgi:hypothetical protein
MNTRKAFLYAVAVMVLALSGCQEGAGKRDETEARYCAMVARWNSDAAAGVAPKNRTGWPPYQGECK